jgi:hypothetical protein
MKATLAVLAAISLAACNKPVVVQAPPETPTLVAAATPTPAAVAIATPAPATPSDIAPEGIYFLLAATSIETSDSVVGLKAGQVLHKVSAGVYDANGTKLTLPDGKVTNRLSIERALLARENASDTARRRLASITPRPTPVFTPLPQQPATPASPQVTTTSGAGAARDQTHAGSGGWYDIFHHWHSN